MIKIKLECWWTNSPSLNKRVITQFVDDVDLLEFEFVDQNPDYTIVFGRTDWDNLETKKENTFYISQEPLWSPNQHNIGLHNYCSKILISDKTKFPNREEYIEDLLPMFYAGSGESDSREEWSWNRQIKNKTYNKENSISMIVRNCVVTHQFHNELSDGKTSRIIYGDRVNLAHKLVESGNVDIFGFHWTPDNNRIKGGIFNKHLGLDSYRFSIACENTIQKNYISEKFWDVILTDTVPIYLGCNNINEHIPDNTFINLNNLSIDEMVLKINEIINDDINQYNNYIDNIKKLKQEFFINPKYNLWEKIKQLINYD